MAARMIISQASISAVVVPSTHARAVEISADRAVPQPAGTTITWRAMPFGGRGPYQYKWLLYNGSRWDVVQNWSGSSTFAWTPAFANPLYRVAVQVRSAGSTTDAFEAVTEAAFAIDAVTIIDGAPILPRVRQMHPAPLQPVSTVTLSADVSSPQPPGTLITWKAAATGGGSGRQFKWFVYDGSRWTIGAPWSTSDMFSWIPTAPNQRCRVAVWARCTGSISDYFEACAEAGFPIVALDAVV